MPDRSLLTGQRLSIPVSVGRIVGFPETDPVPKRCHRVQEFPLTTGIQDGFLFRETLGDGEAATYAEGLGGNLRPGGGDLLMLRNERRVDKLLLDAW